MNIIEAAARAVEEIDEDELERFAMHAIVQPEPVTQVEQDYLDGKWVPSYYGNKFTVAKRRAGTEREQDLTFKVLTLAEAQQEAGRRNLEVA